MTAAEKIDWPDWQNVAAGLAIPGAHVCSWPVASYGRPMLALHQQNKPRRLIRIEFGPNTGSVAGYQCHKGINFLIVYEDEIPQIRSKMPSERDKMLMELAREDFEAKLAKFIADNTRDGVGPTRQEALRDFFPTPWNIYCNMPGAKRTGYPKVLALDVCPDPVPPPETATSAAAHAAQAQAEAMGRAMAIALEERDRRQTKSAKAG